MKTELGLVAARQLENPDLLSQGFRQQRWYVLLGLGLGLGVLVVVLLGVVVQVVQD